MPDPILPSPILPSDAALLLDLDGTLLDIAPTPDSVVVPPDLPPVLRRLRAQYGDALAIVTGRPVDQIDALLPGIPYAVAGEHGGAIRHAPDADILRAPLPSAPATWLAEAARIVVETPGALLERKARGFVLHYRAIPAAGPHLRAALEQMLAGHADRFAIMSASMAWEMKPLGADKATAVTSLMAHTPFLGRTPIYIGDDVTDEDGMRAAQSLGGQGWRVLDTFTNPAGVRAWLGRVAAEG